MGLSIHIQSSLSSPNLGNRVYMAPLWMGMVPAYPMPKMHVSVAGPFHYQKTSVWRLDVPLSLLETTSPD